MKAARRPLPVWADIILLPLVNVALAFVTVGIIVRIIGVDPDPEVLGIARAKVRQAGLDIEDIEFLQGMGDKAEALRESVSGPGGWPALLELFAAESVKGDLA